MGRRTGRLDARFLERRYPRRFELVHLMLKDLDRALQAPSEGFDRDISSPLNLTLAHHCECDLSAHSTKVLKVLAHIGRMALLSCPLFDLLIRGQRLLRCQPANRFQKAFECQVCLLVATALGVVVAHHHPTRGKASQCVALAQVHIDHVQRTHGSKPLLSRACVYLSFDLTIEAQPADTLKASAEHLGVGL